MSDKIDREIEEILNRLDESGPGEDMPDRSRGLFHRWTTNLHRATVSRLRHIPRRRITLASLAVAVLVGAGLFFGLVYPSLGSAGSGDGEIVRESVSDQIDEGVRADEGWPEGSVGEGTDTDGRKIEHGVSGPTEDREEHHREGSEQH